MRRFESRSFDIPKSVILALPASSRTLLPERSRWMMSLEWMYASAWAISWHRSTSMWKASGCWDRSRKWVNAFVHEFHE